MKVDTPLHTNHQLDQLAAQFEHWRRGRSHPSERMPKRLWKPAAALARVLPSSRVAQHVSVSPSDLKKHLATPHDAQPAPSPRFVEVPPTPAGSSTTPGMEIALERPDGARLRLRCSASTASVATLLRTFLEGARCCNSPRKAASFWPPSPSTSAKALLDSPPYADNAWATTPWQVPSTSFATARAPHANSCSTTARATGAHQHDKIPLQQKYLLVM
jgi:hypothetical protein